MIPPITDALKALTLKADVNALAEFPLGEQDASLELWDGELTWDDTMQRWSTDTAGPVKLPNEVKVSSVRVSLRTDLASSVEGRYKLRITNPILEEPLLTEESTVVTTKESIPPTIEAVTADIVGKKDTLQVLNVAPKGTGPFSYNWKKNGEDIEGATSKEYVFYLSKNSIGLYSVVVANEVGSVESRKIRVTLR